MTQTTQAEIEQRYANVRRAAGEAGVDAVVVSGSEYTGFEGAVRYLSGFRILHRYAYVVVPLDGEPAVVFPREARWVGDHGEAWMEQVFAEHPGGWIADQARDRGWRRIGVSGLDYVMAVRDFRALADGPAEIVPFDEEFDLARAVKSEAELESVREGMRINEAGVEAVLRAYEVGKSEAELMGEAERVFTAAGCYRTTMDMILGGPAGAAYPEFEFPRRRDVSSATTCSCTGSRSRGRAATGSSSRGRSVPGSRPRTPWPPWTPTTSTTRPRGRR